MLRRTLLAIVCLSLFAASGCALYVPDGGVVYGARIEAWRPISAWWFSAGYRHRRHHRHHAPPPPVYYDGGCGW